MPSSVLRNITIDCRDPHSLATWWAAVVDGAVNSDATPDDDEVGVRPPPALGGPALLFIRVPEAKVVKNRIHVDLTPQTSREEEVARLVGLGAAVVERHVDPDGKGWVVLSDPEGNEFCVERSDVERAAG